MCGIAGIWSLNGEKINIDSLIEFTDSLAHRGPDGSGYELLEKNTLGLGHRRLSILDLSEAGKQPMYNTQKDLLVTFNGEIYNFIEIRKALESDGFKFKTETDTEVILASYRKWGKNCLNKFNGMFAIAIWDERNKELFIARDRFGVKPLYYLYIPGQTLAFASETIAFKHLSGFRRDIDVDCLNLSMHDPALLEGSNKTIFKNIFQIPGGHFLQFSLKSDLIVKRWWTTKNQIVKPSKSYNEQVEEFKYLFEDACKLRMRSDVSLATALSGGLDSSSVYCTLHKIKKQNHGIQRLPTDWQKAFVATFPNTTVDEKHFAEKVVNYTGGEAVYIVPDYKNLPMEVEKAAKLFDGIIFTPINAISDVYRKMKSEGITVSLDGHGVDEMMYGYNTYVQEAFYEALKKQRFEEAKDLAQVTCGLNPNYKYEKFESLIIKGKNAPYVKKLASGLKNRFSYSTPKEKFHLDNGSWFDLPSKALIDNIISHQISLNRSSAEDFLYDDFHYKDLPLNLRDFDRASMQYGIEIRMPFMDYRLVSYVFSLPQKSKIGNGFTKMILRDAMKGSMPESIRTRTLKIGIGGPDEWYRTILKEFITDTFASTKFQTSTYWDGKQIHNVVQELYRNNNATKSDYNRIWGLISAYYTIN